MAKNNHIVNAFVTGEVSPRFLGRTDAPQYNQGCEELKNMIIHPEGGGSRRNGTIFIADFVKPDGTYYDQYRAFPFAGSDGSRWQIVLATDIPEEQTINGQDWYAWKAYNMSDYSVVDCQPAYEASTGFQAFNDWDLDALALDLNEIQFAQAGDNLFLAHGLFRPIRISYQEPGFGDPNFTVFPFPDPYVYDQSGVAGANRTSPFLPPVRDLPSVAKVLKVTTTGAVGDPVTIETVGASSILFSEQFVGRLYKFSAASQTLVVLVTAFVNVIEVTGKVIAGSIAASPDFFGQDAGTSYEEGAWNFDKGYPRAVCFFESRLVFAGTDTLPDTMWFSEVDDIFEFDPRGLEQDSFFADPVVNSDSFTMTLKSEVLNQIRWMSPGKTLAVGTNSREFIVKGASPTLGIGPLNLQSNSETSFGSAYQQATRIENAVAFMHRDRKSIREMVFNFDEDSFKAPNMNIIASHIASKKIGSRDNEEILVPPCTFASIMMQNSPGGILWCLDTNGFLRGMTREREQQVIAWHCHEIAGSGTFEGKTYTPFIHSISVGQKQDLYSTEAGGEPDELWMVVSRAIVDYNSGSPTTTVKYFLEKMALPWERSTIEDGWDLDSVAKFAPVYMDCAVITDNNSHSGGIITGLPHGHGATVTVICNGIYFGEYTVDDGSIDISEKLEGEDEWQAIIGFNFVGRIVPNVAEVPAQLGSSQGQPRRIDQITVHFYRTIGARFGRAAEIDQDNTPASQLEEVVFKRGANSSGPYPLYTGEKKLVFPLGYEKRPKIVIESHLPFPMTVTHITTRMVVYEG